MPRRSSLLALLALSFCAPLHAQLYVDGFDPPNIEPLFP